MNKAKKIFLAVLVLSFYNSVFASPFPPFLYDFTFFAENEEYLLLHHYAFKRLKNTEQLSSKNPFTDKDNHYSYFLLIRKKDGAVVLKKSSSIFTYGWIDPESKYIVLLSNIDRFSAETPPHIALLSIKGELLFKARICPHEWVLNVKEYNDFRRKFPEQNQRLLKSDAVSMSKDKKHVYISICDSFLSESETDSAAEKYLEPRYKPTSHYSKSFQCTPNGILEWYQTRFPWIAYNVNVNLEKSASGKVLGISLNDPVGKRFTVPITTKDKRGINICVE